MSFGADDGYSDYLISEDLTSHGCNILSYSLVDLPSLSPFPSSPVPTPSSNYDHLIKAKNVYRIERKTLDFYHRDRMTICIFHNCLQIDEHLDSIKMYSMGINGSILTFVLFNKKYHWHNVALKLIKEMYDDGEVMVNISNVEVLNNNLDVTDSPSLFEEKINMFRQLIISSPEYKEVIKEEELEKVVKEYERKREEGKKPIIVDFTPVNQSCGILLNRATRNKLYDYFTMWKKAGYGPGWTEEEEIEEEKVKEKEEGSSGGSVVDLFEFISNIAEISKV